MNRQIRPGKLFPGLTKLGVITTPFGGNTTQEQGSPGVDIANKIGTKVPTTTSGVVTEVAEGHSPGENNYGNFVIVKDPQGNAHRYSHLNRGYVKVGQKVKAGQTVGELGNTGATYSASGKGDGANLDYRIVDSYGRYKNPMTYLKKYL